MTFAYFSFAVVLCAFIDGILNFQHNGKLFFFLYFSTFNGLKYYLCYQQYIKQLIIYL